MKLYKLSNIDWKVLRKVLFQVFGSITVFLIIVFLLMLSVLYFGGWTLLIIPTLILYYVIKSMYIDELVRTGKRQHH